MNNVILSYYWLKLIAGKKIPLSKTTFIKLIYMRHLFLVYKQLTNLKTRNVKIKFSNRKYVFFICELIFNLGNAITNHR